MPKPTLQVEGTLAVGEDPPPIRLKTVHQQEESPGGCEPRISCFRSHQAWTNAPTSHAHLPAPGPAFIVKEGLFQAPASPGGTSASGHRAEDPEVRSCRCPDSYIPRSLP